MVGGSFVAMTRAVLTATLSKSDQSDWLASRTGCDSLSVATCGCQTVYVVAVLVGCDFTPRSRRQRIRSRRKGDLRAAVVASEDSRPCFLETSSIWRMPIAGGDMLSRSVERLSSRETLAVADRGVDFLAVDKDRPWDASADENCSRTSMLSPRLRQAAFL